MEIKYTKVGPHSGALEICSTDPQTCFALGTAFQQAIDNDRLIIKGAWAQGLFIHIPLLIKEEAKTGLLNKKGKHHALIVASMAYLTEPIPSVDIWDSLTDTEQEAYLTDHAWEGVENRSAGELWDLIDSHALSLLRYYS